MKKIMFNDAFDLTQSVLSGSKTMTRRLITQPPYENFDISFPLPYVAFNDKHPLCGAFCWVNNDNEDEHTEWIRPKYKVGDKVLYKHDNKIFFIRKMFWKNDKILYELSDEVYSDGCSIPDTLIFDVDVLELQPYKEEIVDTGCCSMPTTPPSYKLSVESIKQMKPTIVFGNDSPDETELVLGDNYEVKVKDGKTYVVRKQSKYPKTYEECCKVLGVDSVINDNRGYRWELLCSLQELIVCRDAYWKIADDWHPDWQDSELKYCIKSIGTDVIKGSDATICCILAFPTEEMRDAFYENFKELIELVKELL